MIWLIECDNRESAQHTWPLASIVGPEAAQDPLVALCNEPLRVEVMVLDRRSNKTAMLYCDTHAVFVSEEPGNPSSAIQCSPNHYHRVILDRGMTFPLAPRLTLVGGNEGGGPSSLWFQLVMIMPTRTQQKDFHGLFDALSWN